MWTTIDDQEIHVSLSELQYNLSKSYPNKNISLIDVLLGSENSDTELIIHNCLQEIAKKKVINNSYQNENEKVNSFISVLNEDLKN